jgi:hypothetical protein
MRNWFNGLLLPEEVLVGLDAVKRIGGSNDGWFESSGTPMTLLSAVKPSQSTRERAVLERREQRLEFEKLNSVVVSEPVYARSTSCKHVL